jgi:hypothetical protein
MNIALFNLGHKRWLPQKPSVIQHCAARLNAAYVNINGKSGINL